MTLEEIAWTSVPFIIGVIGYFMKAMILNRIEELEELMTKTVTESQVRVLMDDKILPIKEDINEIKATVNKLFDLYIKDRNK